MSARPDRTEAADYYFTYIDKVADGDIVEFLEAQSSQTFDLFASISEEDSRQRYAPGKWSIREVLGHVNDTERLFVFRALSFARGIEGDLPAFDQEVAGQAMAADVRPWRSHVEEFRALREATVIFFRHLPDDAWGRRGVASGFEFTVRALAWITAGHVEHHLRLLRERYLGAVS